MNETHGMSFECNCRRKWRRAALRTSCAAHAQSGSIAFFPKWGGGNYSLLWASGDILSFVALCVAEKIAGAFFEPLKGKAKLNGAVIARFRSAKIPVILIGGDAASKRTMCDILGVNTLANGRRTSILFTSPAAKRNPSLIAHGELLGDVALRLMLQRIAYPEHPPCELYLDIPGEPGREKSRSSRKLSLRNRTKNERNTK